MPIQKAVASSVKTPGFYLSLNLLGNPANPGTAQLRALIMAPKSSAGNITANTEVRQCFGPTDVATALGAGTPGHLAAQKLFQRFGLASLDVVAPTASAGSAAAGTQEFSGTATENSTIRLRVHGRIIDVPWLSGEDNEDFVARAVAYVNEQGNDLFVTAVDATSGAMTYSAKIAGPWGNDVRLHASILEGGGGITIDTNPAACTGGTTEPTFATALTLVSTTEYRRIIPCLSNADAADTSSSSNAERLALHIDAFEDGLGALLQVGVVGVTGSVANAKAGAIDRNNEAMQYVLGRVFDDLPCELAGAEAGDALRFMTTDRPNFNRIGNVHNLYGPRDVVTNKLSDTEVEDLLNNGVTPLQVDSLTGAIYVVRPITTHSTFGGAPDYRALDLPDTDGLFSVFGDLRVATPQQFPNCSISPDLPPGSDPLPPGVVEVKDVRAFVISRLRFWTRQGVLNKAALDLAIENDDLSVEIDESDGTQVNIFVPATVIRPLAKFGMVGNKVA
jgi:phage tail sheath gpL-like